MNQSIRKNLYRIFCVISLVIGIYIVSDLLISGSMDLRMIIVFIFLVIVIIWATVNWKLTSEILENQERELKMYQLYIQPLEELVKEIRSRQHEFDNQLNAIRSMHLTIDEYDELVEAQSKYIQEIRSDGASQYLPLLRISDKVLAGFLYSKIVAAPEDVQTDVEVRNWQVISGISEHRLIEIIGVLVDNAYESGSKQIKVFLDSKNDKIIFEILNQYRKLSYQEIGMFFENGYTTKQLESEKHGIGLYRAKKIVEESGGELLVGQEELSGENYIHFTVTI